MNWKPEVEVNGTWSENNQVFATGEEALAMAKDIMRRWLLVTDYRAVQTEDPVTWTLDLATGELLPAPSDETAS